MAYYLNQYLGEYLTGLDTNSLQISVFAGDVTLTNLLLKPDALNALNLPVRVTAGLLGRLSLKVRSTTARAPTAPRAGVLDAARQRAGGGGDGPALHPRATKRQRTGTCATDTRSTGVLNTAGRRASTLYHRRRRFRRCSNACRRRCRSGWTRCVCVANAVCAMMVIVRPAGIFQGSFRGVWRLLARVDRHRHRQLAAVGQKHPRPLRGGTILLH